VSQERAEARAESMGYFDRELGQPRDSNPYALLIPEDELEERVISSLTAAWSRGWDRADAILQGGLRT
jgi:hypothetical protein